MIFLADMLWHGQKKAINAQLQGNVIDKESSIVLVRVEEPTFLAANMVFIIGGAGGTGGAVEVVVYIKKFRE